MDGVEEPEEDSGSLSMLAELVTHTWFSGKPVLLWL